MILKGSIFLILILIVVLPLCGCISKSGNSSNQNAISDNAPTGAAEISKQGTENLQQTQENQNKEISQKNSALKWPSGFLPNLPEPAGEISSLYIDDTKVEGNIESQQFARIEISRMEEKAADEFIEKLKAGGYDKDAIYEKNEQHTKYYVQDNPLYCKGNRVIFKWLPADKKATIALLKPGGAALEWYLMDYFDDTGEEDLAPWPENFLPNFPEPVGKITDVGREHSVCSDGSLEFDMADVDFYYADRQSVLNCIKEMKKRYYIEADEEHTGTKDSYFGLTEFFGENYSYFDSALIIYENDVHENIIKDHESDNRWHSITVAMEKTHSLRR